MPVAVPSMLDGIAPGIVVAVEERHLLRAVRGIIGRVEVDGDQPGTVAEALGMAHETTLVGNVSPMR